MASHSAKKSGPTQNVYRLFLLRWRVLLVAVAYALPLTALCFLGFFWLFERGWLLYFFAVCLGLSILIVLLRRIIDPARKIKNSQAQADAVENTVEPNPEWTAHEQHIFNTTCQSIHKKTASPIAWEAVLPEALSIVQSIAAELKGVKNKRVAQNKQLDFSAPEALLLIEQTAARYRHHLREKIPFADQVSIGRLYWFWQNRQRLNVAWQIADGGRRALRFATNPGVAAVKEIEQLFSGSNNHYISDQMMATLQTLLLEEVAAVALDLYSGHLKFSDAELMGLEPSTLDRDKARIANPDEPLKILVVGQASVGKSSLLNHLLQCDSAETDAAITTDKVTHYQLDIDGTACHLIDTPGLTGETKNHTALLEEIQHSDMIIWALRADRPSRAVDLAMLQQVRQWQAANPMRRAPCCIFVATYMDRLAQDWPLPEHVLSATVAATFERATQVIMNSLELESLVLVSNESAAWNIEVLASRIEDNIAEALMVQRNRKRLTASQRTNVMYSTQQSARGLYQTTKFVAARWLKKQNV